MNTFGPIALFGSGETSPKAQRIHRRVMELLEPPICPAIVETPAGFEPNSASVAQKIIDYLDHRLQNFYPTSVSIAARKRGTPFSPDDPEIAAPILRSNYLFLGPGSPTYAARQLVDSCTWHTLLARHRVGAALCFSSASTIAISKYAMPVYEIYKVGADLHWQAGLDFFGHFGIPLVVVPHWNNNDGGDELDTSRCYLGQERYARLLTKLPTAVTVLGIEENTGLIIEPAAGTCDVVGLGSVVIVRDGVEVMHAKNSRFAVTELGDWHLPTDFQSIPRAIREAAADTAERVAGDGQEEQPPDALVALAQAREAARERKNWHEADRIRDELAAQGWQVNDTPDGPQLTSTSRRT